MYLPWGYGDASLEVLGIPPEGMLEQELCWAVDGSRHCRGVPALRLHLEQSPGCRGDPVPLPVLRSRGLRRQKRSSLAWEAQLR